VKGLVAELEGMRQLCRIRRNEKIILKFILKHIWEVVKLIPVVHNRKKKACHCEHFSGLSVL